MSLASWAWIFLIGYIGLMLGIGFAAQRKVKNADDFATARGGYGPLFLAFAFAATTASGATFIGGPGLAYEMGMPTIWGHFLYPLGVYAGVFCCIRLVRRAGEAFGSRSIPEYLGERYSSDAMRILVSLFSLLLLFYLAGQLVSGLVMFEMLLGMSQAWALAITAGVLMVYVVLGGAHADIMTDGVQGIIMLMVALLIVGLFLTGMGVDGGLSGVISTLREDDPNLVGWLNRDSTLYRGPWSIVAIFLSHIPLGMLPHLGNKIWALKTERDRWRFVWYALFFGLLMAMIGLAGLHARALFGAELSNGNTALPALFIELFPSWFAALVGVGILAAIMSTADGLVVSSSQIVANDIYRLTLVPRMKQRPSDDEVDRRVLRISRVGTVVVLLLCTLMAWALLDVNTALIVWMGNGGLMAAFAGPLLLGALWSGVTRAGALAGLLTGLGVFALTYLGFFQPSWFPEGSVLFAAAEWLQAESPNPWSCASMGEIASVAATWCVSKLTRSLPDEHLAKLFPPAAAAD